MNVLQLMKPCKYNRCNTIRMIRGKIHTHNITKGREYGKCGKHRK